MEKKRYTKTQIISELSKSFAISKEMSKDMVDFVFERIIENILKKEDIYIKGLGMFKFKPSQERKGRDPRTQKEILIKAKGKILFKTSRNLKRKLKDIK